MRIIRQQVTSFSLPDFRNLGILIRIIIICIAMMFLMPVFPYGINHETYWVFFINDAVWMSIASLVLIIILYFSNHFIHNFRFSTSLVVFITVFIFTLCEVLFSLQKNFLLLHSVIIAIVTIITLHYLSLRRKALSPALAEARLAALTARIRPHFLFNSLNVAIGLIRTRPEDAEMVLENLSDLFRAQLQSSRKESTLGKEIELAQGYIDIEKIRMGEERLQVVWNITAPQDAITPQLLLQPLLENAVYHGIEPHYRPSAIKVGIHGKGNWIYIRIDNPFVETKDKAHTNGNHIALKNLKERLFLMYNQDATLNMGIYKDDYRVDIRIPYYKKSLIKNKSNQ